MTRKTSAVALLLLTAISASAHRLDEYLQGTILSIAKDELDAEITLTPGVAVFPVVIADVDRDADGVISEAEQHAYAERVLRDLSLIIDGHTLQPHLTSFEFPAIGDMKEGRGDIRINFRADLPRGGASRRLIFENHHQSCGLPSQCSRPARSRYPHPRPEPKLFTIVLRTGFHAGRRRLEIAGSGFPHERA
jgi:hypothetical protein